MYEYEVVKTSDDISEDDYEILLEAWKEHKWDNNLKPDKEYIKEYVKQFLESEFPPSFCLVARKDRKIVGIIAAVAAPSPIARVWQAYSLLVYVKKEIRNKNPKVLLNLIKGLLEWKEKAGIHELFIGIVKDKGLSRILQKLGFEEKEVMYRV